MSSSLQKIVPSSDSEPPPDELITELVYAIDDLKTFILETGRERSPAWIGMNFRLSALRKRAEPFVARFLWNHLKGNSS